MCAMDVKLNQPRLSSEAPAEQASKKKKKLFTWIQDLKAELKKVSWTTQDELILSTKVAIGAIFLFGLGIYLVDLVIKGALDVVALVVHFIFG